MRAERLDGFPGVSGARKHIIFVAAPLGGRVSGDIACAATFEVDIESNIAHRIVGAVAEDFGLVVKQVMAVVGFDPGVCMASINMAYSAWVASNTMGEKFNPVARSMGTWPGVEMPRPVPRAVSTSYRPKGTVWTY